MSHNTKNNQAGASEGSGVFDPLTESGFAMPRPFDPSLESRMLDSRLGGGSGGGSGEPSNGEAELRRLMRSRLNAYFDAEGQRDRVAAREALHDLSRMPGSGDELAAMRRVLGGFDTRPEHPDLTRVVLAKVAKRGTFLSKPARRRVSAARVLIAASLLVVVGTFVYIDRAANAPVEGPAGAISAVVEAQRSDAAESVRNLARAVDSLRFDLMEPVGALAVTDTDIAKREPQRSLAMGDTSGYEESTTRSVPDDTRHATGLPLTRLLPVARTDLDSPWTGPNLAGASLAGQPAVAQALTSVQDAWSIAPTPSILLGERARSVDANETFDHATRPIPSLRLDLSDFSVAESIDDVLTRGGLLTNTSPDLTSEPEIRLRPDGSRTVLWWVFPNAAVSPR